jgi:hypothetical protein
VIKNSQIVEINADPNDYHNYLTRFPRGSKEFIMSSSGLRVFHQCPARWVAGYEPKSSEAKEYGSLLDMIVLQPELFKERYAVRPLTYKAVDAKGRPTGEIKDWNGNSKVCQKWLDDHKDFEITTESDTKEALTARRALEADETIARFLEASDRAVWLSAEWHDPKTGLVVPLKALLDLVPRLDSEFAKSVGDLKSSRNAAVIPWTKWCFQAGYHIQAALYMDMLMAAQPQRDLCDFCFILSENYPPFQPGKRILDSKFLEMGRATYRGLLTGYCACLEAGKWPGYDDHDETTQGWSIVAPLPYMEGESLFSPKFEFGTEEPPPEGDEPPPEDGDVIP